MAYNKTNNVEVVSQEDPLKSVKTFLSKRKNAYTDEYLLKIYNACGSDIHSLKTIVAVSGHETGFGTVGSPKQGFHNNFWGWGYNSATKSYMAGDQDTMAKAICIGFSKDGRYYNLINNGVISRQLAVLYSGNDRADIWAQNVLTFYSQM